MNQKISIPKNLLTVMFVIGFISIASSSFGSPKPTAADAQKFLKIMADNNMISGYSYPLLDYKIVSPCKSTWKYASEYYPNHTVTMNWSSITSVNKAGVEPRLELKGAVIITVTDKQKIGSNEWLGFPDETTRDRAIRAAQVIIDECDVLGDAFGEPID